MTGKNEKVLDAFTEEELLQELTRRKPAPSEKQSRETKGHLERLVSKLPEVKDDTPVRPATRVCGECSASWLIGEKTVQFLGVNTDKLRNQT